MGRRSERLDVSPFTGEWIETKVVASLGDAVVVSPFTGEWDEQIVTDPSRVVAGWLTDPSGLDARKPHR